MACSEYAATELLRNGQRVVIRAVRPSDRFGLEAALNRSSADFLYRLFFAARRGFTEKELRFLSEVDFSNHVALVACLEEDPRCIAGARRYIVTGPGEAEIALAVFDPYQRRGIGMKLLRHLVSIARGAGIKRLRADVLPDNMPVLKLFEKSGMRSSTRREPQLVHVALQL